MQMGEMPPLSKNYSSSYMDVLVELVFGTTLRILAGAEVLDNRYENLSYQCKLLTFNSKYSLKDLNRNVLAVTEFI